MLSHRLLRGVGLSVLLTVILIIGGASTVFAVTSNSLNYQVTEMQIGAGSNLENCSGEYCASTSMGSFSSGGESSDGTTSAFDPIVDGDDPILGVIIDPGSSDLGEFTPIETKTKTTTVRVRNHLSDGYTIQVIGDPPRHKDHMLQTPNTPAASVPGTEQFAINVVANSTPNVGANPVQVPSGDIDIGSVREAYRTPDLFMYNSGDAIVRSQSQSGQTDYTISMIVNVSSATPAGQYVGDYSVVVTPVY